MTIYSRSIKCIIGTLKMTILIIGIHSTIKGIQIQATDETDIFCTHLLAMNIADMCLSDCITTFRF